MFNTRSFEYDAYQVTCITHTYYANEWMTCVKQLLEFSSINDITQTKASVCFFAQTDAAVKKWFFLLFCSYEMFLI